MGRQHQGSWALASPNHSLKKCRGDTLFLSNHHVSVKTWFRTLGLQSTPLLGPVNQPVKKGRVRAGLTKYLKTDDTHGSTRKRT